MEEEKGEDCIPQFKGMQDCFLKYPEKYSRFTEGDEDEKESSSETNDSGTKSENELESVSDSGSKQETKKSSVA